tara:strand:+ start:111 stop:440 length:330 start_codon:yes stop_codon:yes gene_type:complete
MDVMYGLVDLDEYRSAKNTGYLAEVTAAADGKKIHMKANEGDECSRCLITNDQKQKMKNTGQPFAKFSLSSSCGSGCYAGTCAGNYLMIDQDPSDGGLLERDGYRYTAY